LVSFILLDFYLIFFLIAQILSHYFYIAICDFINCNFFSYNAICKFIFFSFTMQFENSSTVNLFLFKQCNYGKMLINAILDKTSIKMPRWYFVFLMSWLIIVLCFFPAIL